MRALLIDLQQVLPSAGAQVCSFRFRLRKRKHLVLQAHNSVEHDGTVPSLDVEKTVGSSIQDRSSQCQRSDKSARKWALWDLKAPESVHGGAATAKDGLR